METERGITIKKEDIDAFFSDVRLAYAKPDRELTEFQNR